MQHHYTPCQASFPNPSRLAIPQQTDKHFKALIIPLPKVDKPFKCQPYDMGFTKEELLASHLTTDWHAKRAGIKVAKAPVAKPYPYTPCGKAFPAPSELLNQPSLATCGETRPR